MSFPYGSALKNWTGKQMTDTCELLYTNICDAEIVSTFVLCHDQNRI